MKVEHGRISSSALLFLIIGFIQANIILFDFNSNISGRDTWLCIIAALTMSIPIVYAYCSLSKRFPGKNLFEIHELVYGSFFGKVISAGYIFMFLSLMAVNIRVMGDFFLTFSLPETPLWAILIMFTFVCAWAVRAGLEVIARCSHILVLTSSGLYALTILMLLKDMEFSNLLPVLDLPLKKFIQSSHVSLTIFFLEVMVFLAFIPYVNKLEQAKKSVLLGLILGGVTLLIIELRNITTLGPIISISASPGFATVRMINVAKVFTRLDMIVAYILFGNMFLKASVIYYATVLGLAQTLRLKSYTGIVIPVGIIAISLAISSFDSSMEQIYVGSNIWPFIAMPFEFFILITLLVAKIRGLPKGGKSR
ncbi:MAG TPA: endospore germination permease [Peptococcaceae bacterium]|nr:endospore germination permease [Peptococcaceae bacterium]